MKAWLLSATIGVAIFSAAAASHSDLAAQIGSGAERPLPGQYQARITFQSINIPGAPPQVADMMRNMMTNTVNYCLTPAEIEEGFRAITDRSTQDGQECTYERFSYQGGEIDAVMMCKVDGQSMRMEMTGSGNATSSDITMKMNGDFGVGDGSMTLRAQHERIGECS